MTQTIDWPALWEAAAILLCVGLTGYAAIRFGGQSRSPSATRVNIDEPAHDENLSSSAGDYQPHLDLAYHNARREIGDREAELVRLLHSTRAEFKLTIRPVLETRADDLLDELRTSISELAQEQGVLGRLWSGAVEFDSQSVADYLGEKYDEWRAELRDLFVEAVAEDLGDSLSAYKGLGGHAEVTVPTESHAIEIGVNLGVGALAGAIAGPVGAGIALVYAGVTYKNDDTIVRETMSKLRPLVRSLFCGSGYRSPDGDFVLSLQKQLIEDSEELSGLIELHIAGKATSVRQTLDRRYRELTGRLQSTGRPPAGTFHSALVAGEVTQFFGPERREEAVLEA